MNENLWFDGAEIKSVTKYGVRNNKLAVNINHIAFFFSLNPVNGKPMVSLDVRLKHGEGKIIKCQSDENGSIPIESLKKALEEADEYLARLSKEIEEHKYEKCCVEEMKRVWDDRGTSIFPYVGTCPTCNYVIGIFYEKVVDANKFLAEYGLDPIAPYEHRENKL